MSADAAAVLAALLELGFLKTLLAADAARLLVTSLLVLRVIIFSSLLCSSKCAGMSLLTGPAFSDSLSYIRDVLILIRITSHN